MINHSQDSGPAKIAYLLNNYPNLTQTFIVQEILELERQGLQLRLFSLFESPSDTPVEEALHVQAAITYISHYSIPTLLAAAVRRFLKAPWRYLHTCIVMGARYRRRSVLRHLLYAAYLTEHLNREGIVHLHAHFANESTSVAQAVHLFSGIPYSFTAHAFDIYLSSKAELVYKIRMARLVVTCTAYNQRYLAALVDQHVAERIHCIYHGLNLRLFPANITAAAKPLTSPLILMVGRLIEKKGQSYLLRACRILKDQGYDFICRIVGDGPLRKVLELEIRELELSDRVELWGAATHKRVIEMYQQATITSLPCIISKHGDRDGIPNVLIESLWMGVPVVSTSVSGIPEVITSEVNGLLVPSHDCHALATALARLLNDPSLRCRLADAGRQTVLERFDMASNARRLIHLFRTDLGVRQ